MSVLPAISCFIKIKIKNNKNQETLISTNICKKKKEKINNQNVEIFEK